MTSDAAPQDAVCIWCGSSHVGICPRVKAYEYYEDFKIKRVEFHPLQPAPVQDDPPEHDDALRKRVQFAAGRSTVNQKRIETDTGKDLDEVAEFYDVKRRGI